MNDKRRFVPITQVADSDKDTVDSPTLLQKATESKEIAELDLQRTESEVNTKLLLRGYQNIEDGLKDIHDKQELLNNGLIQLEHDRTALETERQILAELKDEFQELISVYNTSLESVNNVIERQEQITNESNRKLATAESKLANFNDLVTKHDLQRCEKCHKAMYCEYHKKDFQKWESKI